MEVGCRTRIPALTVVRRTPKISSSFFPNISSYMTIHQVVHVAVNGSYISFQLSLKVDPSPGLKLFSLLKRAGRL